MLHFIDIHFVTISMLKMQGQTKKDGSCLFANKMDQARIVQFKFKFGSFKKQMRQAKLHSILRLICIPNLGQEYIWNFSR